ncbi:MAG: hypothetical protein IJU37_10715, partial [Desulfovibrio sp.]|nr:hypothetical protein [Desulfovibrio sp.]
MPELTFNLARRLYKQRCSFAHECKTNLRAAERKWEYEDAALGLLAVPYCPQRKRLWKQLLSTGDKCRYIKGGWWTNGFTLVATRAWFSGDRNNVPSKVLSVGETIDFGCLLYYRTAQRTPTLAFCSETATALFHLPYVDDLVAYLAHFAEELTFSFSANG